MSYITAVVNIFSVCNSGSTECQWRWFSRWASVRTDTEHRCTLCWQSIPLAASCNNNINKIAF